MTPEDIVLIGGSREGIIYQFSESRGCLHFQVSDGMEFTVENYVPHAIRIGGERYLNIGIIDSMTVQEGIERLIELATMNAAYDPDVKFCGRKLFIERQDGEFPEREQRVADHLRAQFENPNR